MQRTHRIAVVCAWVIFIAGCTTLDDRKWYQDSKEASVKAADAVAETTTKTFRRMQHYLAEKDVLQSFHDAGEHSEAAVLEVLHRSKARGGAGKTTPRSQVASATGPHPAPAGWLCPVVRGYPFLFVKVYVRDTPEAMHEVYPTLMAPDTNWQVYREYYCPECGTMHDVEAPTPWYPVIHEFEPDIEAFYTDWVHLPLPEKAN